MKNIQYNIGKQRNFVQLKHTHIPRKLQTYIHKHTEKIIQWHTQIIYPNTKQNCLACRNPWVLIHKERASVLSQQGQLSLQWQSKWSKCPVIVKFMINNLIFASLSLLQESEGLHRYIQLYKNQTKPQHKSNRIIKCIEFDFFVLFKIIKSGRTKRAEDKGFDNKKWSRKKRKRVTWIGPSMVA